MQLNTVRNGEEQQDVQWFQEVHEGSGGVDNAQGGEEVPIGVGCA